MELLFKKSCDEFFCIVEFCTVINRPLVSFFFFNGKFVTFSKWAFQYYLDLCYLLCVGNQMQNTADTLYYHLILENMERS